MCIDCFSKMHVTYPVSVSIKLEVTTMPSWRLHLALTQNEILTLSLALLSMLGLAAGAAILLTHGGLDIAADMLRVGIVYYRQRH